MSPPGSPLHSFVLEIPRIPESPNNFLGFHWRHRQNNSKLWQQEVYFALRKGHLGPALPYPKARVHIERRSRGQLDPDNLVGCVKPIIDALRYALVLIDDSPDHLMLQVTQIRSFRLPPRTRIEIQPLENV
jgi:hypothetical protein